MEGFFLPEELAISRGDEVPRRKNSLITKTLSCRDCGLYKNCHTPLMKLYGRGEKSIFVLGEGPGASEDAEGIPFIGRTGRELREALRELDIDLLRDCWTTNAVRCRPPGNREPTAKEIQACRRFLLKDLERLKPRLILIVGATAWTALLEPRMTGRAAVKGFAPWTGECIPDQELQAWVCPINHPSYILRREAENKQDTATRLLWKQSLRKAVEALRKPFPRQRLQEISVEITTRPQQALAWLQEAFQWPRAAFDYETTGKKPHRTGHKILYTSLSNGKKTYSFPFFGDNRDFVKLWSSWLQEERVQKVAQNFAFEALWSHALLGVWPRGWCFDTMLAAHLLHNWKPVNLKYLTYTHFGILGYDAVVDPYIETTPEEEERYGANGFNRMGEAPLAESLEYCGFDSYFEYQLQEQMAQEFTPIQKKNFEDLLLRGQQKLVEVQEEGFLVDDGAIGQEYEDCRGRTEAARKRIFISRELKLWDREKPFNPDSSADLGYLLYTRMQLPVTETTETGNPSVNEKALLKINSPIAKEILEYKRWEKAAEFLRRFQRESVGSLIHGFLNLGTVRTFRSSSNDPNLQNVPSRDEEVKKKARSVFRARLNHKLVGDDYKGIEVSIAGAVTQDDNLLAYLRDRSKDMHRDRAQYIFLLPAEKINKKRRYAAKNMFVFPEFYGSYYVDIARDLWDFVKSDPELRQHIIQQGLGSYRKFESHIQDIEEDFWGKQFPGYAQWRRDQVDLYNRLGYVDAPNGFRYHGPMKKNEIINYQIQGPAFHVLLWTLIEVSTAIQERQMQSRIITEIHDQQLFDVLPEEEEDLDYLVYYYGTQKVKEYWPWITVPLDIEKESTPINGSWADLVPQGFLADLVVQKNKLGI